MQEHDLTFVRALAEEYARKYNPDQVAPFPYQNVIDNHPDLEIIHANLEDRALSGATLFKDDTFTILINTVKADNRQHFTLGHELGHYFLHQDILKMQKGILDGDAWLDSTPRILHRLDDAQS